MRPDIRQALAIVVLASIVIAFCAVITAVQEVCGGCLW